MDSLGSLNAFVQAAEARSFTIAGRQLGVSSSAIGKAVARMEERLGVRLFHRSTRSVTLRNRREIIESKQVKGRNDRIEISLGWVSR